MQEHAEDFKKLNAELIFVFREERSGVRALKKLRDEFETKFTLALDLNKAKTPRYSPKPKTFTNFVIDSTGKIRLTIPGSVTTRAKAKAFIAKLKEIEGERKKGSQKDASS
ncbi:MAG TPA: hypothetical protein DDW52_21645 [Planctomycetaceae bacterium]|nr:hypothetical protein [Planctomycetaceae bacterium]